jgi:hypothetical protein
MAKRRKDQRSGVKARIAALEAQLKQLSGGKAVFGRPGPMPDAEYERFLRRVVAFDVGPFTTNLEQLARRGIELPAPDSLDDDTLRAKLQETITALAELSVFVSHTDHLSDRELYVHLWTESLREEVPDVEDDSIWHLSMLGGCSLEDNRTYLTFYADEEERRSWLEDFPDYEMPAHKSLPYDRDRYLPQP